VKVETVHPSCYIDRAHANGSDAETIDALYLRFGLRSRFWWCQCPGRVRPSLHRCCQCRRTRLMRCPADAGLGDHRLGKVQSAERRDM
jgi:hypothetical protein